MKKWESVIADDGDRLDLITKLENWQVKQKCLVTIKPYKKNRTDAQNALFAVWARQRGEQTGHGEIYERCYLKLQYGIPIMMHHDYFRDTWEAFKAFPYEAQHEAMRVIDVTSLMSVDEMTIFLNHVESDSYDNGLHLTKPRQYDEAMG